METFTHNPSALGCSANRGGRDAMLPQGPVLTVPLATATPGRSLSWQHRPPPGTRSPGRGEERGSRHHSAFLHFVLPFHRPQNLRSHGSRPHPGGGGAVSPCTSLAAAEAAMSQLPSQGSSWDPSPVRPLSSAQAVGDAPLFLPAASSLGLQEALGESQPGGRVPISPPGFAGAKPVHRADRPARW